MTKRKILAMLLSALMLAPLFPVLPISAGTQTKPVKLPEVGSDFYIESVGAASSTALTVSNSSKTVQTPVTGEENKDWYTASGVIFSVSATNADSWLKNTAATNDPYFCFSVLLRAKQTVPVYAGTTVGSTNVTSAASSTATFWTTDYFHNARVSNTVKAANPSIKDETATFYMSDDNGATWTSTVNKNAINHKFHAANLKGKNTDQVLIYIPMGEFFYYGGYSGGEGKGVNGYYSGITTFGHGIEILKGLGNTALHSVEIAYRSAENMASAFQGGVTPADVSVTVSDVRLVYDLMNETTCVQNGDTYEASLLVNEPTKIAADKTVTATLDGNTTTLTGVRQTDGRVKYTLPAISLDDGGKTVTFTYTSATDGVNLTETVTVGKTVLRTLPTTLDISSFGASDSVLSGAKAAFFGDSLTYAARDRTSAEENAIISNAGWAGRLGNAYGMTAYNYGKGGWTLMRGSVYNDQGSTRGIIFTRIQEQINAESEAERNKVSYVILQGGVNDITDGAPMGALSQSRYAGDTHSFIGGLEYNIELAKRAYPNAKVGFIIVQAMPNASKSKEPLAGWQDWNKVNTYIDAIRTTCEKWNVPYLDMFGDAGMNDLLQVTNKQSPYLDQNDWLHLNKAGYQLVTPYIAAWMETLNASVYFAPADILSGVSLSVSDSFALHLFADEGRSAPDKVVTATLNGKTETLSGERQQDGRIKYTLANIAPQYAVDTVTFTWKSESLEIDISKSISIMQYCESLLNSTNETVVDLARALLHYAAEMQKTEGYKATTLCNANAGAAKHVSLNSLHAPYRNGSTATWKSASPVFEGGFGIQVKINAPEGATKVFYRVDGRDYGRNEYESVSAESGTVTIPLSVSELDRDVNLYFTDGKGAIGSGLLISANYTLKSVTDYRVLSLVQAIVDFGAAVSAYAKTK